MKKLIIIISIVFLLSFSAASAKEQTHFEMKKNKYGYGVAVALKDSKNCSITTEQFDANVTDSTGEVKYYENQSFYNGIRNMKLGFGDEFKIDLIYNGSSKYLPCNLSDNITTEKLTYSKIEDYYYNDYESDYYMDDHADMYFDDEDEDDD